jgi:hypothetical protein
VKFMKSQFCASAIGALFIIGFSAPVGAWTLNVNNEVELPIWTDSGNILNYHFETGLVSFGIDGPFFCFDFDTEPKPVLLDVINSSGQLVFNQVGMPAGLNIDLIPEEEQVSITTAKGTRCFVEDESGFRLMAGDVLPSPALFRDAFEAKRDLSIRFETDDVPVPGDIFEYYIVIENIGNVDIELAGFQELYNDDPNSFDAWFVHPYYECVESTNSRGRTSECGTVPDWDELESFRVEDLVVPTGTNVRYRVERRLHPDSILGATVKFMAGAVSGYETDWDPGNNAAELELGVVESAQ